MADPVVDPNADINALVAAMQTPSASAARPIPKIETPDQEKKARAALATVGANPAETELLIDTGRTDLKPLLTRLAKGPAKPPKPAVDYNLMQTRLMRDNPDIAQKIQGFGPEAAPDIQKILMQQALGPKKAEPFAINPADLSPEEQAAVKGLSPADASAEIKTLRGEGSKRQRAGQLVDRLKAQFPQYAPQIEALRDTPEALPNIMSSLYAQQFKPDKPDKFQIDRSHLPPGLARYAPYLSDEQIGNIAAADYKNRQTQGGNPPGFKGLTIVQDDRFKRSGLKTGDTVCIKIP